MTLKDSRGGSVNVTVETCTEQTREKDQQQRGQGGKAGTELQGGLRAMADSCILTVRKELQEGQNEVIPR